NSAAKTLRQRLVVQGLVLTSRTMRPPLLQHTAAQATSIAPRRVTGVASSRRVALLAILDRIWVAGSSTALIAPTTNPRAEGLMNRPRFEAPDVLRLLVLALGLFAAASALAPFSSPAGAAAAGKLTLAWHAGFASRWLDPQEHDGTATPDNFFTAIHDA